MLQWIYLFILLSKIFKVYIQRMNSLHGIARSRNTGIEICIGHVKLSGVIVLCQIRWFKQTRGPVRKPCNLMCVWTIPPRAPPSACSLTQPVTLTGNATCPSNRCCRHMWCVYTLSSWLLWPAGWWDCPRGKGIHNNCSLHHHGDHINHHGK